jgi:hypothetical protein
MRRIEKSWATRVRSVGKFPVQKRRVIRGGLQRKVRHAVQHRGTFQPPDEQRIRLSSGLKRKSCTKRRMRQRSEQSQTRDPAAARAEIRRGKNFQTRCWRDPAQPRRARKAHLKCAAAIGLLLRVRHGNPC